MLWLAFFDRDPAPPPTPRTLTPVLWADVAGGPLRMGADTAPVEVVAFGDYQCPFCRASSAALDSLRMRRPDVAVSYRAYPLPSHPAADRAAAAALCADDQGAFADAHHSLYQGGQPLHQAESVQLAEALDITDPDAFASCLDATETSRRVERDIALGRLIGIEGVPTFVVNGLVLEGGQTLADLEVAVDAVSSEK